MVTVYGAERKKRMKMWGVDDLAAVGDLARDHGVTNGTVGNWTNRYPDFPAPITIKAGVRLYSIIQVRDWKRAGREYGEDS